MHAARHLRSVVVIGIISALATVALSARVEAFGPAAHYVVMEKVAQGLPEGSSIRQAMAQHLDIAAAAASGPDVPYCQLRGALGYAPWADRYHYDRVGTFAAAQLRRALASGDVAQVAWAAGWVTHVTGDLASHGLYVNPEAGVYLENREDRWLHKDMESAAEAVVWVDIGGHPQDTYSKKSLPEKFCGSGALPLSLLADTSSYVFGRNAGSDYGKWYQVLKTGLSTGIGYTYRKYPDAKRFLDVADRSERLTHAVDAAVADAITLLQSAEGGDYAGFSDAWNLDAGKDDRPFGTLTVTVRTGNDRGAGTDGDIYFGLAFADGTTKEWLLDKQGYDDLERRDDEDYYLFLSDKGCQPTNVTRIYLKMGKERGLAVAWQVKSISVRINGNVVLARDIDAWLNHQGDTWESAAWNAPR